MRDGYRIIDADAHVMEPDDLWERYIDREFRLRAPRRVQTNGDAWGQMVVDGVPVYRAYPDELVRRFQDNTVAFYGEFAERGFDPKAHILAMDRQGIDISFLYPSLGLGVAAIDGQDPRLAWAICRAYNDWLTEYVAHDPERLKPVGLVSLDSCEYAIHEATRCARELGMKAVMVRPNPVRGRPLGHAELLPFFAKCEALGIAVALHEGCHTRLPAAGADRFTSHFAMHSCCHPMEQMMAFLSLVEGGVFERNPGLRVGLLEAGCGWVPYWLWRLDELEWRHWRFQVPEVKQPPSAYFRRQCFVSAEGCEPYLGKILADVGSDRLLFASDYPHPDHEFGEEVADVFAADLSDEVRRAMFWDNPVAFYGLDL